MANLTWTVSYTGTPDSRDIAGATHVIENENAKRAADVDENGDPNLPPLPYGTGEELRASYLFLREEGEAATHERSAQQAAEANASDANVKELWQAATPAQQAAAVEALQF